ncbi:MAG: hypothetical protein ACRD4W_13555, partial [Nitrososphaeraceae archaeon]
NFEKSQIFLVWVHDILGAKSYHVIVLLFIFARVAWIWFEEACTQCDRMLTVLIARCTTCRLLGHI